MSLTEPARRWGVGEARELIMSTSRWGGRTPIKRAISLREGRGKPEKRARRLAGAVHEEIEPASICSLGGVAL